MALAAHGSELDMWLDEGRCVSARWLSCQLGISASAAVCLFNEYKLSHANISTCYVVSGEGTDGNYCINICTDDKLEETKSKLSRVNSSNIYSLQKSVSDGVFNQIRSADYTQTKEMLSTPGITTDSFLKNEFGAIVFNKLEVAETRSSKPTRALRPAPVPTITPASVKDSAKKTNMFGVKSESSAPSAGSGFKEEVVKSAAVQNFFGKKSTDVTKSKPAESKKAETVKVEKSDTMAKKSNDAEEDVDDDGEWNDGSKYETDKSNLKKRKSAETTGTFEERDEMPDAPNTMAMDIDLPTESEQPSNERKSPNKFKVYGAMDSFIEDAAISEHKKDMEAQRLGTAATQPASGKNKRRKLVPKMFSDDKGYLVTEMVYEDCEDDEEPEPQPSDPVAKKAPVQLPKPSAVKASSAKGKEAAGKGQKSMMSFFGAKK